MTLFTKNLWSSFSPKTRWRHFVWLLILLVLAQGTALMCVMPLLEGWDEYQHIAYIQYLVEHDELPVLRKSMVSRTLLEKLVKLPQPRPMTDQTKGTGALDYDSFHRQGQPAYRSGHEDIPLYQAQHGSLYYRLMLPVFQIAGGIENLTQSIALLRLVNLLLTTATLAGCLWLIGSAPANRMHAALLGLVICCQPLFLINGCRVANDALAIAMGTVVIIWALKIEQWERIGLSAGIGVLLGLAVWTKSTAMALVPFIAGSILLGIWRKRISFKKAILTSSLVFGTALIVSSPYFAFNFHHYHMLTPMQEGLVNRDHGKGLTDFLKAGWQLNAPKRIGELWIKHSTWVGGWSHLQPRHVQNGITLAFAVGLLGWGAVFWRRLRNKKHMIEDHTLSLRCAILVFCVSLGLLWHMVQSYVAWFPDGSSTNAWYACMGFPFALILVYEGATGFSDRIAKGVGWLLVCLYGFATWYGFFSRCCLVTAAAQADGKHWCGLAEYQPPWLSIPVFFIATSVFLCVFVMVIISQFGRATDSGRDT